MNILICILSIALPIFIFSSPIELIGFVNAQSNERVNWGEICKSTFVDIIIAEPCNTLTSPDGYALTPQGQRVLTCIAGGGLLLLADPTGETLLVAQQTLGSTVGCTGSVLQTAASQPLTENSLLGGLFQGLLPK